MENSRLKSEDDAESCTTLLSHSAQIIIFNFYSDGAYLYSGDKEGVLVVWELDTGKKQLLPNIGSPLLYFIFSSDPILSSVICADNLIHLPRMPSAESYSPYFAVLIWLPESYRSVKSNEQIFCGKDGAILLVDGSGPKPVAIWTVMKAKGGTLSFVEDGKKSHPLIAYVNRSHEYVLFDPYGNEKLETSAMDYEVLLAAISNKKKRSRKKALLAMSDRPWESKFCGSTLNVR